MGDGGELQPAGAHSPLFRCQQQAASSGATFLAGEGHCSLVPSRDWGRGRVCSLRKGVGLGQEVGSARCHPLQDPSPQQ